MGAALVYDEGDVLCEMVPGGKANPGNAPCRRPHRVSLKCPPTTPAGVVHCSGVFSSSEVHFRTRVPQEEK